MTFSWTYALITLALVPAALAAYLWLLRRRRRTAIRFSNLALVRAALPARSRWRRHVPFALVLAAVGLLALGSARPQVSVQVPMQRTSIILAIDVSRSMCAVDVQPNRLSAAQEAVRGFIQDQDDDTRIGLVAFAGYAEVVVAPTVDRQSLVDAVDALTTGRGTTIGAAILKAVDAIAAINPDVAPVGAIDGGGETSGDDPGAGSGPAPAPSAGPIPAPAPTPGRDPVPDIVVLLTDGANTRGITPVAAARVAASRGVRVYPIGFGTRAPTQMVCSAEQLGGQVFAERDPQRGLDFPGGGAGGAGFGRFLLVDEPALRAVAETTGATYRNASDGAELSEVLDNLPRDIVLAREDLELTAGFAALAILLLLSALGLSVRWRTFP